MNTKTLVSHSIEIDGNYLGMAQATPVMGPSGSVLSKGVSFQRHCVELQVTDRNGLYWPRGDGKTVAESDLSDSIQVSGIRPMLPRMRLPSPNGTFVTVSDKDNMALSVYRRDTLADNDSQQLEACHYPHRVGDLWQFFRERHNPSQSDIIVPIYAVRAYDSRRPTFERWDPVNGQTVVLQAIKLPVTYQAVSDFYPSDTPLDEVDIDILRTRSAAYVSGKLKEHGDIYIAWDTPESIKHVWEGQTSLLEKAEFYSPEEKLRPPVFLEEGGIKDLMLTDMDLLDVIEPEFASSDLLAV